MNENIIRVQFPWLSLLLTFLAAGILFIINQPGLAKFYDLPPPFFDFNHQLMAIAVVSCIILWDMRRFFSQLQRYDHAFKELLTTKKQLQNKVHTYSGHSEKLKLFISDRLLEYIQYDEKFLHFKNIASEVRHNGVICYDKIQTALNKAIEQSNHNKTEYEDALSSMRYLWDLLDLSTTDNIALHIGDYLCECEEYYFQSLLNSNVKTKSPYKATYFANEALITCLTPIVEQPKELTKADPSQDIVYSDSDFTLYIDSNIEMLGNENHLRLLFENLINNAQFYHKKNNKKDNYPISIKLINQDASMLFSLYNRGQHIKEESRDKIFQLAYTTRRKKDNHGKGLGLYFVSNIVQGYEGHISFTNINNVQGEFSLAIYDTNGEIYHYTFEIDNTGPQPVIINTESNNNQKNIERTFNENIKRIEVTSERNQINTTFDDLDIDKKLDVKVLKSPNHLSLCEWQINLYRKKRSTRVVFTPLDIKGVVFSVQLPTAKARLESLDNEDLDIEESHSKTYAEIMERENRFKNLN